MVKRGLQHNNTQSIKLNLLRVFGSWRSVIVSHPACWNGKCEQVFDGCASVLCKWTFFHIHTVVSPLIATIYCLLQFTWNSLLIKEMGHHENMQGWGDTETTELWWGSAPAWFLVRLPTVSCPDEGASPYLQQMKTHITVQAPAASVGDHLSF